MNISVDHIDAVTAVGVQGRIDSTNADALKDRLAEIIQAGTVHLAFDFRDVIYISSSGFRVLLITARAAQRAGGRMVLCGLSKEIERLFDIAAFSALFTIFTTRDEAVNALRT